MGLSDPSLADPVIEVTPMMHDFGDVDVGTSSTTIITVSNVGGHPLIVDDISLDGSSDFAITSKPSLPAYITPPNGQVNSIDVEVTYTPASLGYTSAVLQISSTDLANNPVLVNLGGVGIDGGQTPVTITDILAFFDQSVADGTLYGNGPGKSDNGRKKAMRNKLKAAGDLIDGGYIDQACEQLLDAYQRCDGLPRPPEFVAGPARSTLAQMILNLMGDLGCE
jgi:hypothetical protein